MKKDKHYLDKFFVFYLMQFLILQILFVTCSILYAAGGHGIFIPLIIFYGPLLILLSPLHYFVDSVEIQFLIVFIIFFIFFLLFYFKFPKRKLLIAALIFYFSVVMIMIIYHVLNGGITPNMSFLEKFFGIAISILLSFLFWRMFFKIAEYKSKNYER